MDYYLTVLLKFVLGFVIIITHLNFSGKTQLSQMTPVDFIGNFVLGGVIGGVIYSDTIPLYQYVSVLLIGIGLISGLNFLSKHVSFFRSVAIGKPIPIIKDGKFLIDNITTNRSKIDILNIASQMHTMGIKSFQQIYYAQIEPSGQLSIVCDEKDMPSVIVMKDGVAIQSSLAEIKKDEDWMAEHIAALGLEPEEIFVAEFWNGQLTFVLQDGSTVAETSGA
ncbi:DUF421 domain-containing protein [Segnochrobactraceae bacterium EtOH-i3]